MSTQLGAQSILPKIYRPLIDLNYKIKFTTGTELRLKYGKIAKNSENHKKLVINSKKQVKNHVILYYISVNNCQITHMRTVAVQPPILCKKNK